MPVAGATESARPVLITNEQPERVKLLAQVVAGLGYEVIARDVDVEAVAAVTAQEHPDVALVGVGRSSQCAPRLIEQIAHGSCPVIALLSAERPDYVREAARRGVFAYVVDTGPAELQSAIDITLERCERKRRQLERVAYAKVAEFQARGLVHFHVIVRLDGAKDRAAPPGVTVSADELCEAIAALSEAIAALSEEKSVAMIEGIAKEIG